jgi:fucose permease
VSGLLYAACLRHNHMLFIVMLFIVGVGIMLIAVGIIPRMWVPGGVNSANLGWMSEQWLAEHRASHSL